MFLLRPLAAAALLGAAAALPTVTRLFCADQTPLALNSSLAWQQVAATNANGATYAPSSSCSLLVTAPPGFVVALHVNGWATEASSDFFAVYDGSSAAAPALAGPMGGTPVVADLLSSRASLFLRFTSDAGINLAGVSVSLTVAPQVDLPSAPAVTALAAFQVLALSTNAAAAVYASSSAWSRTFTAPPGFVVAVAFIGVATQSPNDALAAFDGDCGGSCAGDVLMATASGSALPPDSSTTGRNLTLAFTTDAAVVMAGVSLVVTAAPLVNFCASQAPVTLGSVGSALYSPLGSPVLWSRASLVAAVATNELAAGALHPSPADCSVLLTPPAGFVLTFSTVRFDAPASSSMTVFAGTDLLASSAGSSGPGSTIGSNSGDAMTLRFVSTVSASLARLGAFAVVSVSRHLGICDPGAASSVVALVPGRVVGASTNPVSGAYGNNANCVWHIAGPPGYVLRVRPVAVATEYNADTVSVYDGATAALTPRIFALTGSAVPEDRLTTRPNATVVFTSDTLNVQSGVRLLFSLVQQVALCDGAGGTVALMALQVLPVSTQREAAYANNAACSTTFTAPAGFAVVVSFSAVATEADADVLRVLDGPSTLSSPLLPGVSGSVLPQDACSSGNSLTLAFSSNAVTVMAGVQLVLRALPQLDFCTIASTGTTVALGRSPLQLAAGVSSSLVFSPASGAQMLIPLTTNGAAATYTAPADCKLTVSAFSAYVPVVHVTQFSVDSSAALRFFDGAATSVSSLLSSSPPGGSFAPWDASGLSPGGALTISFASSAAPAAALSGARLFVAAQLPLDLCRAPAGVVSIQPGQALLVSTNPASGAYGNNANCVLNVAVPPGFVVNVRPTFVSTEACCDSVGVFDGASTAATRLLTLSGGTVPSDVLSSRTQVTLTFNSDNTNSGSGVRLLLTLVRQTTICDQGNAAVALAPGQVLPVSTNTGALYADGASCVSTFTAPEGHAIAVSFASVALEAGADVLRVLDGPTALSPMLIPGVTGSLRPADTCSSATALTLAFSSNPAVVMGGAQLVLRALPQTDVCGDLTAGTTITLGTSNLLTSPGAFAFVTGAQTIAPLTTNAEAAFPQYRTPAACSLSVAAFGYYVPAAHVTRYAVDNSSGLQFFGDTLLLSASSGTRAPWDAYEPSPGGALTISFASSVAPAAALSGARLFVAAQLPLDLCRAPAGVVSIQPGQALLVSTNPASGAYGNNANCVLNVAVPPGFVVNVRPTFVSTEACCDSVGVFDGASTAATRLLTLSGGTVPSDVLSSRPNITLTFTSNANTVGGGVRLLLTMVRQASICEDGAASLALLPYQALPLTTNVGALYSASQACNFVVTAPAGFVVALAVQAVQTEALVDWLEVYDGPSADAPLLLPTLTGAVAAVSLPSAVASSGAALTLLFSSNAATASSGVQLVARSVPQLDLCGAASGSTVLLGQSLLQTTPADAATSAAGGAQLIAPFSTNALDAPTHASPASCSISISLSPTAPGFIPLLRFTLVNLSSLASVSVTDTAGTGVAARVFGDGSGDGSQRPAEVAPVTAFGPLVIRFASTSSSQAALGGVRMHVTAQVPINICRAGAPSSLVTLSPGATQLFATSNWPSAYGNSAGCGQPVTTEPGYYLLVRALHVGTETCCDIFTARSGLSVGAPVLATWAGSAALTNGSTPSNQLYLQFSSDSSNNGQGVAVAVTSTRNFTYAFSPSPSRRPSASASFRPPSPSNSGTPSPSASGNVPSASASATPSPTPTQTGTGTGSPTPTVTPSPTLSTAGSASLSSTLSTTATASPTPTPSPVSPSSTPPPTSSPAAPSPSSSPTGSPSAPSPSSSPAGSPAAPSPSPTPSSTASSTPTPTPTGTSTKTATQTPSSTLSATATPTASLRQSASLSASPLAGADLGAAGSAAAAAAPSSSPLLAAIGVLAALVVAVSLYALRQRRLAHFARRKLVSSTSKSASAGGRAPASTTPPAGSGAAAAALLQVSGGGNGGAAAGGAEAGDADALLRRNNNPMNVSRGARVGGRGAGVGTVTVGGGDAPVAAPPRNRVVFAPLSPGVADAPAAAAVVADLAAAAATATAAAASVTVAAAAPGQAAAGAAGETHWVECRGADGSVWFVSKSDAAVAQWTLPPGGLVVDSIHDV